MHMAETSLTGATLRMAETIPPRSLSERYKKRPPEDDREPEDEEADDSDTWTPGLVEADPAEAARFIVDWLRSSGVAIVDQERLKAGLVDAARVLAKT